MNIVEKNEMRWEELRWDEMKYGVWSVGAKYKVWSGKSAEWSAEFQVWYLDTFGTTHHFRIKHTHTHNYVHASSIDENSLVAEDGITLKQLPPRGTTVNTHHLILLLLRIVKNILISQLLRNDCRVAYWMYDSGRRSSGRSVGICRARTSTRSFALESTRKRGFIGQFHQSGWIFSESKYIIKNHKMTFHILRISENPHLWWLNYGESPNQLDLAGEVWECCDEIPGANHRGALGHVRTWWGSFVLLDMSWFLKPLIWTHLKFLNILYKMPF